jgi:VWFA-related protein
MSRARSDHLSGRTFFTFIVLVSASLFQVEAQQPAPPSPASEPSAKVVLATTPSAPVAPPPLTADQASILNSVREYALGYTKGLPNFICTQMTNRKVKGYGDSFTLVKATPFVTGDRIEEKLTYIQQKEHYEVVAIDGKKVDAAQHMQLNGAISAGEFGSTLHDILDPESHTIFTWDKRITKLRGRSVYVFDFEVPQEAGTQVSDHNTGQIVVAPYHGLLFVDASTRKVVRVVVHIDLPPGFPIELAQRIVDYKPATIAGKSYNLPFHSEIEMREAGLVYTNKIEFTDYHKFAVESTIHYGNVDLPQPANAATTAAENSELHAPPADSAKEEETRNEGTREEGTERPAQPAESAVTADASAGNASQPASPAKTLVNVPADASLQLHLNVDTVIVPVVVRDSKGQAVGNLTKGDFQLFDKGKQQEIAGFTVQTRSQAAGAKTASGNTTATAGKGLAASSLPANFVVYLFDDVHLSSDDLARVKEAAAYSLDALRTGDQAAILTTSELVATGFTSDRAKLQDALNKLRAEPLGRELMEKCPAISYYMADQILNQYEPTRPGLNPPLLAAAGDAFACMGLGEDFDSIQLAVKLVLQAAQRAEEAGEHKSRTALLAIRDVVRWVAKAPGSRSITVASPGLILSPSMQLDAAAVIDEAIHSQVVIGALGAHGPEAPKPAEEDQSRPFTTPAAVSGMFIVQRGEVMKVPIALPTTLEQMAAGTGGTFVNNGTDFFSGFSRLAAPPEYTYLLSFHPQKLKLDGRFHPLKVKLTAGKKLNLQARLGYYAARQ